MGGFPYCCSRRTVKQRSHPMGVSISAEKYVQNANSIVIGCFKATLKFQKVISRFQMMYSVMYLVNCIYDFVVMFSRILLQLVLLRAIQQ